MRKERSGFLLLEAVLVISAISFLLSITVGRMRSLNIQKKHETLRQNYDLITHAIAAYLAKNNRLPKPAKDKISGVECDISSGYVPYKTLGISIRDTTDGSGNYIKYTPAPELTKNFDFINYDENDVPLEQSHYFCKPIENQSIKILDQFGQIEMEYDKHVIAFVLSNKSSGFLFPKDTNIFWITRDILLTKYLKMKPCKCLKTGITVLTGDDILTFD